MGLTSFDAYRPAEQVDEMANATDMMGDQSEKNLSTADKWFYDPTKSLIAIWIVALALYWLIGYLFRGARS
jgi:hypothetical protein